jgi:hypothetical protein
VWVTEHHVVLIDRPIDYRSLGQKWPIETALAKNTKIVVPMNTELVNIIGEMAGILPLPSRGTTPEKAYPVAPVRGGTSEQPFKGNGSQ